VSSINHVCEEGESALTERLLTRDELNRATLARQFLLEPMQGSPLALIERLVALQGQVQNAPYIGLWTRMKAFERAELTKLIEQKQVARAASLRMTLQLMRAEDYVLLHPLLQTSARSRRLLLFARRTEGFDLDQFRAVMRAYLQEKPRTGAEVRRKMAEISPGLNQDGIVSSATMQLALIQTFPAGTWNYTGPLTYAEAEIWLSRSFAPLSASLRHLILRYLAAFGPASIKDLQIWSGLTSLQSAVEALRSELTTFRDERGQELFDLSDAPRPDARSPAPVRFLPEFDNLLLAHEDRRRLVADPYRRVVFPGQAMVRATFLVNGLVQGTWKVKRKAALTTLVIEPFESLSHQVRHALRQEGERFITWLGDGTDPFEIQFSAPLMKGR
jgi:hypothetical protein